MRTAVLLDLDGTLTDPRPGIVGCIRYALERAEIAVPEEAALVRFIGPPLLQSLQGLTGDAALAQRCLEFYRERFAEIGYRENAVYPGVPEALAALRVAGHRLVLATSKPLVYARRILEHFDLASLLHTAYGAELDGRLSDKGELIAALLAGEQLAPENCVMVGDRAHDVRGAVANGMACIGVLYGYGDAAELRDAGAARIIARPDELPVAVATLLP